MDLNNNIDIDERDLHFPLEPVYRFASTPYRYSGRALLEDIPEENAAQVALFEADEGRRGRRGRGRRIRQALARIGRPVARVINFFGNLFGGNADGEE